MSLLYGVRIVGLYGVRGIGKTTICKAMCNDLSEEYRNKVAHVELGSRSEEELLREVLGKLTDKNLELLGAMDVDQYRHHLMRDMMNAKVFLTIDNVSSATIDQALILLRANYGLRSVVLVTARSLNELNALRIDASDCMEMPKLEMEEARSLFLYHALCVPSTYLSHKDDHELISSCVERCHFKKGDGISRHYHPLALQALGGQLGCIGYVPEQWRLFLYELDFLNPFGERHHPVFSILRRSFDALEPKDQLLFMDVALFALDRRGYSSFQWNIFEWLGMVHGIPMKSVIQQLENLKRKSVLENLGNGFVRIGMHDLWREFARLETKVGEFEKRRWMFEWDESIALEEASLTNGGCLVNVRRMFFLDKGFMKLEDVNFFQFPNVTVLKLSTRFGSVRDLDLRGLKHLKSLELDWPTFKPNTSITLIGLGSLLKLGLLRWSSIPSNSPCIDEIGCLTNLQALDLDNCGRLPNLRNLVFLQVAHFCCNNSVVTLIGLSSKHTNLQFLDLSCCAKLQSCWGVSELVALEELCLNYCSKLIEVPNLQKLKRLRKLDVNNSSLLRGLPSLDDLVSLLELDALWCWSLVELPDMHNLRNLRKINLRYCKRIEALLGLNELVCLQSLDLLGCKNLTLLPDMYKLTNLQTLRLDQIAPLQSSSGWSNLILLQNLYININELYDGSDLRKLTKLEMLHISGWQGRGFSSLVQLVSLESFTLENCKGMRVLPNLERLSRLQAFRFEKCKFEDLSTLMNLTSLEELEIKDCNKLDALPNLQELAKLKRVRIMGCAQLRDLCGILGLRNLESLSMSGLSGLHENLGLDLQRLTSLHFLNVLDCGFVDLQGLAACSQLIHLDCNRCHIQQFPDLADFPNLKRLIVRGCVYLTKLTCTGSMSPKLQYLDVSGCTKLQALPDLSNSQKMQKLDVSNSGVVLNAQLIQDIKAHWPSIDLVTHDSSFVVQRIDLVTHDSSFVVRREQSSHGIWRRSLGMIASLHCGCIKTSSGVLCPN